jgi:hypothetical protein
MTKNNRILICMLAFFAIVLGLIKLCQTGGRKSVARQGAADGRPPVTTAR